MQSRLLSSRWKTIRPPCPITTLGVAAGDVVGMRLTEHGLAIERIIAPPQSALGARLAATVDSEKPVFFAAAVWTVCVEDPAIFTEPLQPLCEIVDDFGLAHRGDWLAPGGFDFDRWRFEQGCALLAAHHDLDPDDAVALYTLVKLYDQISLLLLDTADADEPSEEDA